MVQEILTQIFVLAAAAIASGMITTWLTELLKWDAIKIPAERYPVLTAAVLSTLLSAGSVFMLMGNIVMNFGWWIIFSFATLLVATQNYEIVRLRIKTKR